MSKKRSSKTPKRGQPRRRVVPFWRHRYMRGVLAGLLVVLAVAGGWRLWDSGWVPATVEKAKWKIIAASAEAGFKV